MKIQDQFLAFYEKVLKSPFFENVSNFYKSTVPTSSTALSGDFYIRDMASDINQA